MRIFTRKEIEAVIDIPYFLEEIEKGLILFSQNKVQTSPVGFLHFKNPPGDAHIKSGAIENDDLFVVKVATGFWGNFKIGLSSSNGLMILLSQKTGEPQAILLEEGMLTNLRTALAGAICAKYLAPKNIHRIGIIGTGIQAKEQLRVLASVTSCKDVLLWGRSMEKANALAKDPDLSSFSIQCTESIVEVAKSCNLIVTTTPSKKPLLFGNMIQPGTHITAVGADDIGKQELDKTVFDLADLIVADSITQCMKIGDLAHASSVAQGKAMELGTFIHSGQKRRADAISIADLTGIAVEDLQIAKAVFSRLKGR